MNNAQFNICKVMQACGVTAATFAGATHTDPWVREAAWAAHNYGMFVFAVGIWL